MVEFNVTPGTSLDILTKPGKPLTSTAAATQQPRFIAAPMSTQAQAMSAPTDIAYDPETGKSYDVTDPSKPREIDPKTGKPKTESGGSGTSGTSGGGGGGTSSTSRPPTLIGGAPVGKVVDVIGEGYAYKVDEAGNVIDPRTNTIASIAGLTIPTKIALSGAVDVRTGLPKAGSGYTVDWSRGVVIDNKGKAVYKLNPNITAAYRAVVKATGGAFSTSQDYIARAMQKGVNPILLQNLGVSAQDIQKAQAKVLEPYKLGANQYNTVAMARDISTGTLDPNFLASTFDTRTADSVKLLSSELRSLNTTGQLVFGPNFDISKATNVQLAELTSRSPNFLERVKKLFGPEMATKLQATSAELEKLPVEQRMAIVTTTPREYTKQELAEIQSGKWKVFDYQKNEFVNVTKKDYQDRLKFYAESPGIAPPGTPGTITPAEAKRRFEAQQAKIASGELIPIGGGQLMDRELFNSLSTEGQKAVRSQGVVALEQAEAALKDYKHEDSYDIAKVVWDSRNNPKLLQSAKILFRDQDIKDAQELINPSNAWLFRDPAGGQRYVSNDEKEAIIAKAGFRSDIRDRFVRTQANLNSLLVNARYSLADYAAQDLPKNVDVPYLDKVASQSFFDEGGTAKERIALANAMRSAGYTFESGSAAVDFRRLTPEQKQEVAANWGAPGPIEEFLTTRVMQPTASAMETATQWAQSKRGLEKFGPSVLSGALNALGSIALIMPATVLTAAERVATGRGRTGAATLAEIPMSMVQWAVLDAGKRIKDDPVHGVGTLVGEIFGVPVGKGVVKGAMSAPLELAGRRLSPTSIKWVPESGHTKIRPGATERGTQATIQSIEELWAGKTPESIKIYGPDGQKIISEVVTGNETVVIPGGGGTGLSTAWLRIFPRTGFHASGNIKPIKEQLSTKGYYEVLPIGQRPVEFLSPHFAEAYRSKGVAPGTETGGIAHFYSVKDMKPLPKDLLGDLTDPGVPFSKIRSELMRRATLPKTDPLYLEQGIYPLFKSFTREGENIPIWELEFVVTPGFRWYTLKPESFMPKDAPTASIKVPGTISYKGPKGVEIVEGQPYEMLFVASENAIKEGAKAPTLPKLAAVWALDKTIYAMERLLAPKTQREVATTPSELATSQASAARPLYLSKPAYIQPDVVARTMLNEVKGRSQLPFTDAEVTRLGDWIDSSGTITRTRDQYWHPDAETGGPKGYVYSRATAIVRDPRTGDVILVREAQTPGALSLPGGKIEYGESIVNAVAREFLEETGVNVANARRMPIYYGKATEHAMPGSYVVLVDAASLNFKPKAGEILEVVKLKSGDSATVTPATLEILRGIKGFDTSNLKVQREGWSKSYNKHRDPTYGDRADWNAITSQTPVTPRVQLRPKTQPTAAPASRELLPYRPIRSRPSVTPRGAMDEGETKLAKTTRGKAEVVISAGEQRFAEPTISQIERELAAAVEAEAATRGREIIPPDRTEGEVGAVEPSIPPGRETPVPVIDEPVIPPGTEPTVPPTEPYTPPPGEPPTSPPQEPIIPPPGAPSKTAKQKEQEDLKRLFAGGVAWRQGVVHWVGRPPFNSIEYWRAFSNRNLPAGIQVVEGGPGAAYRSIQALGYNVPKDMQLRLGFQKVNLSQPAGSPGKEGAIGFERVTDKSRPDIDVVLKYRRRPAEKQSAAAWIFGVQPAKRPRKRKRVSRRQAARSSVLLME